MLIRLIMIAVASGRQSRLMMDMKLRESGPKSAHKSVEFFITTAVDNYPLRDALFPISERRCSFLSSLYPKPLCGGQQRPAHVVLSFYAPTHVVLPFRAPTHIDSPVAGCRVHQRWESILGESASHPTSFNTFCSHESIE